MVGSLMLLILILSAMVSPATGEPTAVSMLTIDLSTSGDTLVTVTGISGIQGSDRLLSRMVVGFDPAVQSVELLEASFGIPGSVSGPVPGWAVDTLSGSSGMPLSLVVAYPALREGMEMSFTVEVRDWSGMWRDGPWAVVEPNVKGMVPGITVVTVSGSGSGDVDWEGEGWTAERSRGVLTITADTLPGTLWLSPLEDWAELDRLLLGSALEVLDEPRPLDLREAALQATAAGAGAREQLGRMRSLLCNSISLETGHGTPFTVAGVQEILDSRQATRLEMAVLLVSMCSELGIPAEIVPATSRRPVLPLPEGWNRFLVRATDPRDAGTSWLLEPSAYLVPAFYIASTDTLWLLEEGGLSNLPQANAATVPTRERWELDPESGRFVLELDCRGWFDASLRRRIAGLDPGETILALSQWAWRSGRLVAPDSVTVSDPFALDSRMTLRATGDWCYTGSAGPPLCETVPWLDWGEPETAAEDIGRSWLLPGLWLPPDDPAIARADSAGITVLMVDSGGPGPFPVVSAESP